MFAATTANCSQLVLATFAPMDSQCDEATVSGRQSTELFMISKPAFLKSRNEENGPKQTSRVCSVTHCT